MLSQNIEIETERYFKFCEHIQEMFWYLITFIETIVCF